MNRRLFLCSSVAAGSPAFASSPGSVFPRRAISWVLPFPPGGIGDALSRLLSRHMTDALRSPVVVDNRPGAGGQIAASYVKQRPADGHTLFNGDTGSLAMNPALYKRLGYDPLRDFAPVTRLAAASLMLVVPQASSIRTFEDLVEASRRAPNDKEIIYGSFGVGSISHIGMELLQRELRVKLQHLAYPGSAAALQDLIGQRIDVVLDLVANSLPYVEAGKLRGLAVMGREKRLERLPQVPTIADLGFPRLNVTSWNGLMVRVGTPVDVIERLHSAATSALRSDEIKRRFLDLGIEPAPQRPPEFGNFVEAEIARWRSVIRGAGVALG